MNIAEVRYWGLDELKRPVPIGNLVDWAKMMQGQDRVIRRTAIVRPMEWFRRLWAQIRKRRRDGKMFVSTVFLGIDHGWGDEGAPLLYETMIFGGPRDQGYQERYSTLEEALAGHEVAVAMAQRDFMWTHKREERIYDPRPAEPARIDVGVGTSRDGALPATSLAHADRRREQEAGPPVSIRDDGLRGCGPSVTDGGGVCEECDCELGAGASGNEVAAEEAQDSGTDSDVERAAREMIRRVK